MKSQVSEWNKGNLAKLIALIEARDDGGKLADFVERLPSGDVNYEDLLTEFHTKYVSSWGDKNTSGSPIYNAIFEAAISLARRGKLKNSYRIFTVLCHGDECLCWNTQPIVHHITDAYTSGPSNPVFFDHYHLR
jgi:hypothetical protein